MEAAPVPVAETKTRRPEPSFAVTGLLVTDSVMVVPLDYSGKLPGTISLFYRQVVHRNKHEEEDLPYLVYLQGGPGFESPRPLDSSGWLKQAAGYFRVILLDQRGTGLSTAVTPQNLPERGSPAQQAAYLSCFRADSIVEDCERLRAALVPSRVREGRWSVLGQSFGGFCCAAYLSRRPEGLAEALFTGGLPPLVSSPCAAPEVYRRLARRVLLQNRRYYERFPADVARAAAIVRHLADQPQGWVETPAGNRLTPRAFQSLGLSALGFSHGFERLHYLLEQAWDGSRLSLRFCKEFDSWASWDTNPLYALLHESIYCQGDEASLWAAQRALDAPELRREFDAVAAARENRQVNFTGEMVFPWMFEDFKALRPLAETAQILAEKRDWTPLYDAERLARNAVPAAAVAYFEDMFVDFDLSQGTAQAIKGLRLWVTNEYLHCGIREG
ncbi:hypothetical protein H632_c594p1, partial [Helicosporidium sp. ATCC 50920]